ncbi:hypothetical protein HY489_05050 [Candidatus Woesearchaeota archaeon]|nr:hypothetical protein [Candidatus Woesearchaeota archaeon]
MRKTLAGLILALAGCAQVEVAPALKREKDLQEAVAKEMRKHGQWVEKVVRQDYNIAPVGSIVSIALEPSKEESCGFLGHIAAFNDPRSVLLIPENVDTWVFDAIDHELGHVVQFRVIGQQGYAGPSWNDIATHCTKKVQNKGMEEWRTILEKEKMILGLSEALQEGINEFNSIEDTLRKKVRRNKQEREQLSEHAKYVDESDRKMLEAARADVNEKIKAVYDWRDKMGAWAKSHTTDQSLDALSTADIAAVTSSVGKSISELDSLGKKAIELTEKYGKVIDQLADKTYSAAEKDLQEKAKTAKNEIEAISYRSKLERLQISSEEAKKRRARHESLDELDRSNLQGLLRKFVKAINSGRVNKIGEPSEFFARMVDSLYSLRLQKVGRDQFPLTEEDLKLFEQCTFEGKPIFGTAVQKYRLGMQMTADGIPAEHVKNTLEYATSFAYKGKTYCWSPARVAFRGSFPRER